MTGPLPPWLPGVLIALGIPLSVRADPSDTAAPGATWTGVELATIDGLAEPRVDGFSSGFTADFKGGLVRVYVMPTEQAASWWVARMALVLEKQKPAAVPLPDGSQAAPGSIPKSAATPPTLDDCHELLMSGDRLVIARIHNVALAVEVASGARAHAEAVLSALTDLDNPWPAVPVLERTEAGWVVQPPAGITIRYEGSRPGEGPGLHFARPPTALVAYDAQGRASRQAFDPLGLPVPSQPPWMDHEISQRPPSPPEPK